MYQYTVHFYPHLIKNEALIPAVVHISSSVVSSEENVIKPFFFVSGAPDK